MTTIARFLKGGIAIAGAFLVSFCTGLWLALIWRVFMAGWNVGMFAR